MKKQQLLILVTALALMGITAGVLARVGKNHKLGRPGLKTSPLPGSQNLQIDLPAQVLNCESEPIPIPEVVTNTLPRDTSYGQRMYKSADGFQTVMNVVLMGADRTSIHKPQFCLTGQGWKIDRSELLQLPIALPHPYELPVMKLTATRRVNRPDGQEVLLRGVYVYWFVADGRLTARHGERMWWMARDLLLTGELQRWAYVTLFAVCEPGQEDAIYERMKQFIVAAVPQFQLVGGSPTEPAAGRAVP